MATLGHRRKPNAFTQWVARRIWRGRPASQVTLNLIHLQNVLRFALTFALTVIAPSLILAWLGVTGSRSAELAVMAELDLQAGSSVDASLERIENIFSRFESKTTSRLLRGLSPSESLLDLSPYLLLSMRLDQNMSVAAPFKEPETEQVVDHTFFFTEPYIAARKAELEDHDYTRAEALYSRASARARGVVLKANAELQRARVLAKQGRIREAEDTYADIVADYSQLRDPWGFPLGSLAFLKRGELLLQREPEIGVGALSAVVKEILNQRWEIGRGGEAAVARRALVLMEGYADNDTIASLRKRLDERTNQLYWAERFLPELKNITHGGVMLMTRPGEFNYTLGNKALWAVVWFQEALWTFALDLDSLLQAIHQSAEASLRADSQVKVSVQSPDTSTASDQLARRSLAPWMPGWSLVAYPLDARAIADELASRRKQRLAVIGTATLLIIFGVAMSAWLLFR